LDLERLKMPRDPEVMNTQGTASFLGVHVETVRRLARCGDLPSFKVGKDWRFRKEALLRWTDSQQACRPSGLVLIVDDDEKICRALVRIVEGVGCKAQSTTDGRSGLEIVSRTRPDLILLDLAMPGMNGPQFLKELRLTHPNLPVVIVTAYPDSELMAEAMKHGPLLLLPKPFEATEVEKIVGVVVGDGLARNSNARIESDAAAP
jgi:excisionase family DNA binding protein